MPSIDDIHDFLSADHGLAVVSTARSNRAVLSSVVNAGVMPHPVTEMDAIAFVSGGSAARLGHLRRGRPVTIVARQGWRWVGVTGRADLFGPDDPADGFDPDRIRLLLRDVFAAAGGSHDDWDEFDRVMAAERRVVVVVHPDRITGNV